MEYVIFLVPYLLFGFACYYAYKGDFAHAAADFAAVAALNTMKKDSK